MLKIFKILKILISVINIWKLWTEAVALYSAQLFKLLPCCLTAAVVTVARNETTRNKNVENQNLSISYQIFEINPSVIVIMKGIGPIKPLESFDFINF